ncbi:hypothetical protein A9P82_06415 [Arachidicoccus ginsenosidimutans]|uniref:metallophosphoesterase family protein n=1 Tax=Arachidicoccus sp. BS20 TaxID=1850526 RepID=UPI0007F11CC6|nr:metallophosphoesterase family protein [Arachidicoccus sp. BS20]ANI88960.1 hypothetical protein A9P82_06415 [Arachidicoccus sp. BS20]
MKLAFISDIHANLPALETTLRFIERQKPDGIYCLGDLVNFACFDNEVIDLLRKNDIPCIQGNHDEGIGNHKNDFSFSYANKEQKKFGLHSIKRVNKIITDENRKYLSTLPFMLQLEFRFPFHHLRLAMVHGSPFSNNDYVMEATPDELLNEMMDNVNADILLMGHTHVPYHKTIFCEEENKKIYRHAINVGSVGKSKTGSTDACCCFVNINHETTLESPESVEVHFEFLPYDKARVVQKIHDEGLSHAYDNYFKTGKN